MDVLEHDPAILPIGIKPLCDIDSMDSYLQSFGGILGKKAVDALSPLHIPDRDPLPDFDDLARLPFPCQQHVIAASVKMLDRVGSGFIVGEMGCIAGESEVFDPVAGVFRRVDQITEPFHVVSYDKGWAVVGNAHVPFIKGTRDLFRVSLSDGRSFLATDHHRILTDRGWQLISEVAERIRESGPCPVPSIPGLYPSASREDAIRSSRKPSGSLVDYLKDRHLRGERLQSGEAISRGSTQRLGDALAHSRGDSLTGDRDAKAGRIHACPSSDPRSMSDCDLLTDCTSLLDAFEPQPFSVLYAPGAGLGQGGLRSAEESPLPDTTESSLRSASQSGCEDPSENPLGEFLGEYVHVTEIVFTRHDVYYDFTVDEYHNYVMSGIVHHNTGKTLLGIAGVHNHAKRSRNQGGKGGKYRVLVLCPDHLIGKWCREIKDETLHEAIVTRFGREEDDEIDDESPRQRNAKKGKKSESGTKRTLRDIVSLLDKSNGTRWKKPVGAEWYVLGRNQAKWLSDWSGIADKRVGFNGRKSDHSLASKSVVVDIVQEKNEYGRVTGEKREFGRVFYCPTCGTQAKDGKGVPVAEKALTSAKGVPQKRCSGLYAEEIPAPDTPRGTGLDRLCPIPDRYFGKKPADRKTGKPADEFSMGGRRYKVMACGEHLYNYTSKPYRWSPARLIQKKMKRLFSYLVVDEVHEQKSDVSAQSMACGKLISSVDHVVALTGTIIGGYADHLFPLMMRITPKSLRDEGFEWGKDLAFSEMYGRIDRVQITKEEAGGTVVSGNTKSMRKAKSGDKNEKKYVRPGVMPTMFGRHLIGSSMFITLEELAENLPDLFEYVGGEPGGPPEKSDFEAAGRSEEDVQAHYEHALELHAKGEDGWFETAVDMLPNQKAEYNRVVGRIEEANTDLLQSGSMKLMGTYLWTALDFPDQPFGWGYSPKVKKVLAEAEGNQAPGLLGQSFLSKFDHAFDIETQSLMIAKTEGCLVETDRIPLRKDGGIYWLDVTFNGNVTKSLAYDTGASSISIPEAMADEIGLKPKQGDSDVGMHIADGSVVRGRKTTASSVTVGKFTLSNVECVVMPAGNLPETIGYWREKGNKKIDNWVGVVTPRDLPEETIYPKEQALIDICKKQKADGTQTWVYVNMTGERNIQPRLKKLLQAEGLKVGVLRSGDVDPIEREEWIAQNGRKYDVMLSYPSLVSTGLDLFSKAEGGHNYSTLVFYETGYNLFTMRQAARRAWRIGQPRDCRVYYLYYKETMQHKAMSLMSRKMAAAQALEGEFSEDGLAAMAGEDNAQMALAKSLSNRIDDADVQRSWGKINSGPKKLFKKPSLQIPDVRMGDVGPALFDDMPIEVQLVAESMVDSMKKKAAAEKETEDTQIPWELRPKGDEDEPEAEDDYDPFDDDEDDGYEPPAWTPEVLAGMLDNMLKKGQWFE